MKLEPVLYPKTPIKPPTFFTYIFKITNTSLNKDSYQIIPNIPEDWQIVSTFSTISLEPNESKTIFLTTGIPQNVSAAKIYYVNIEAVSLNTQTKITAKTVTKFLSYAKPIIITAKEPKKAMADSKVEHTITIINKGIEKDIFLITAKSIHFDTIDISENKIILEPEQKKTITITAYLPYTIKPGIKDRIIVRVSSMLIDKSVFEEQYLYTYTLSKKSMKQTLYRELPTEMKTYLSGFTTNDPIAPQISFTSEGPLDKGYKTKLMYMGPFFENRDNHLDITREDVLFELGKDKWTGSVGDISHNISYFLGSQSGKGYKLEIDNNFLKATLFTAKKRETDHDLFGGKITKPIGKKTNISFNFLKERKTDDSNVALIFKETKSINSISFSDNTFKPLLIEIEGASGSFHDNNTIDADAGRIKTIFKKNNLFLNTEYIYAGSDFIGQRKDVKGYQTYLTYRFFKRLYLWAAKTKQHNNLNNNPNLSTTYTDNNEIGLSIKNKILSQLAFSYKKNKSREDTNILVSNLKQETFNIITAKSFGKIRVYFNLQRKNTLDPITSNNHKAWVYSGSASRSWSKLTLSLRYRYNKDLNITDHEQEDTISQEASINYKVSKKLNLSARWSNDKADGGDKKDYVNIKLNYIIDYDSSLSLETKMDEAFEPDGDKWKIWFAYKRNFGLLIPWLKIKSLVSGIAFIDKNNNQILDKEEQGLDNITLNINFKKNFLNTDKQGKFKFPPMPAGEYVLNIDTDSLPMGLTTSIPFPINIDLKQGKHKKINIPLVKSVKIKGRIFYDKNKNKKIDPDEKGESLIKISLYKEKDLIFETHTNNQGEYSFDNILPGKYKIIANKEWLPKMYIFTTQSEYAGVFDIEKKKENVDFGIVKKAKKIIITYKKK